MKHSLYIFLITFLASCSGASDTVISIKNSSDKDRTDASAVITREQVLEQAKLYSEDLPVLIKEDGTYIPSQTDDLDQDGAWDELFIVTDIKAGEELKARLSFIPAEDYPVFEARTNIRFARKDMNYQEVTEATRETHAINTITQEVWQMEGIAFENDKIAFRNYFDRRNGMDIFGKLTTKMVLDSVGHEDYPEYHSLNPDWGLDALKVGNSLGAGSIAYLYNDSLYRVGDNGSGTCTILAEGPLRSIFRFDFPDWNMGNKVLNVEHIVTIQAGTHYFDSKVKYTGTEEEVQLVTGIVNKKSKELFKAETDDQLKAFYTFDLQAEDTTLLGMGIMVDAGEFIGTSETRKTGDGITETYCIHILTKENSYASYRFYSVWEFEDIRWKTAEGFEHLLMEDAYEYTTPLKVEISR